MATNAIKYDDPTGNNYVRPVQDGRTVVNYPFLQNGDTAARVYSRSVLVRESNYVPLKPGTDTDAVWPAGDPNAYSLPDSPLSHTGMGDLMRLTRSYARIPGQQVSYPGSRQIPLPAVTNDYAGLSSMPAYDVATSQNIGDGSYSVAAGAMYTASGNALYGPTKAQSARLIGIASGGTFTLTYGASTTGALNWNDSNATIAAAVNILASVISAGLTATASNVLAGGVGAAGYLTIGWTGGVTSTKVTMNAGSLTVSTSNNPTSVIVSYGTGTTILLPDHYTIASHGFNTGVALAAVSTADTMAVFPVASWGSIDANTIWLPGGVVSFQLVFGPFARSYIAGRICLLRTRLTEDFFLPLVTPGITTAADIPITIGLQNTSDFIAALLTLTGWQTYETEGPAFWIGGPIYRRAYLAINLNDIT